MDDIDFFVKIKDFQKVYETEVEKLPFHFNVIDELHANENAHSRILQKILLYKNRHDFPFLRSFLQSFLPDINEAIAPIVAFNKENIDLLIEDAKSDFACIIENKIHWATDQWKQVERYVEIVKAHGKSNIYVVYLTSDGNKQISDYSLTSEVQSYLGYENTDNTGNFIPLNYKEHILPWLKDNVLNNCSYKESKMIAGIIQYIDHLEGIFNIRKDKRAMNETLIKFIQDNFGITDSSEDSFERIEECKKLLNIFQTELDNLKQKIIQDNPWKLPANEKAIWLSGEVMKNFNGAPENAAPFSKIWVYQKSITVFDQWKYKDNTFAIDVDCGHNAGPLLSILTRTRCSAELYQDICKQNFFKILKKHNLEYRNNWRYMKKFDAITNENEKTLFIEDIKSLLTDLNTLVLEGE